MKKIKWAQGTSACEERSVIPQSGASVESKDIISRDWCDVMDGLSE